jgi:Trk K+ transport system NAD-binding subunit
LGDLLTFLRLKGGKVALVEAAIESDSSIQGKQVKDLKLSSQPLLVGLVRGNNLFNSKAALSLKRETR